VLQEDARPKNWWFEMPRIGIGLVGTGEAQRSSNRTLVPDHSISDSVVWSTVSSYRSLKAPAF